MNSNVSSIQRCGYCGGETLCSGGNWICQNEDCPGSVEIKQIDVNRALKSLFDTSNKTVLESFLKMSHKTLSCRITNLLKAYYFDGYRDGMFAAKQED